MVTALLLLPLIPAITGTAQVLIRSLSHPPIQTPFQKKLLEKVNANATIASKAATPELFAYLNTPSFRANVSQYYPPAETLPAQDFLSRFLQEMQIVEYVHNFEASVPSDSGYDDLTVAIGRNSSYFQNLWELITLGYKPNTTKINVITDAAETGLMGFEDFSSFPPYMRQAEQRPVYSAVNGFKTDGGNYGFGNISFVYNRAFTDPLTLLTPIDSGNFRLTIFSVWTAQHSIAPCMLLSNSTVPCAVPYVECMSYAGIIEFTCNKTIRDAVKFNFSIPLNCSFLNASSTLASIVGVPTAMNHLLLQYEKAW